MSWLKFSRKQNAGQGLIDDALFGSAISGQQEREKRSAFTCIVHLIISTEIKQVSGLIKILRSCF